MCGAVGCTQVPPTEFWFPDNLPEDGEMERRKAEQEREEPVSGDAHRPTADGFIGRPRRRRARTGRRSRWPSEDRAIHGPREDR